MSESNDKAFIKISKDLLCLRNDLLALNRLESLTKGINAWQRDQMRNIRPDRVHSEKLSGLSLVVKLMGDYEAMIAEIKKIEHEIDRLEILSEAYIRGEDIVQTRLAMD